MKVSLDGLISQAGSVLRSVPDRGGPVFAYCLDGLHADIKAVVAGEKSIEAFAEFWNVKPVSTPSNAGGRDGADA